MYDLMFADYAIWFTIPAILGTLVFILRLAMLLIAGVGGDAGGDMGGHGGLGDVHDAGAALDHAGNPLDVHHSDALNSFKVLSLQSIATFLMGFGWAGLGALKGSHWGLPISIVVAGFGGVAMVWLLGMLLKAAFGLQSSGNIGIHQTIGSEAVVYVSIPQQGSGMGQVMVVVDERQRTYNAVSVGPAIPHQSRVRVLGLMGQSTLTVAPA